MIGSIAPARAGTVAITVDDLPIYGSFPAMPRARATTSRLLDGFRRHHWPVTGFVNEGQLDGGHRRAKIALLARWLDAGADLGNHGYSHYSLTATPVASYLADLARGDRVTARLLARRGRRERWFRHPFLETGTTPAIRNRVDSWLTQHGYRVAPVSLENADWEFDEPYEDALAHGHGQRAKRIRRAYLAYTVQIIAWYRATATAVLGREPAYIFLLHASRLNAASIDALAVAFDRAGLRPVTLDQAMADPAYRIRDSYAGPRGYGWIQRWAITLHRPWPATMPRVPAAIARRYAALEAADPDVRSPPDHRSAR